MAEVKARCRCLTTIQEAKEQGKLDTPPQQNKPQAPPPRKVPNPDSTQTPVVKIELGDLDNMTIGALNSPDYVKDKIVPSLVERELFKTPKPASLVLAYKDLQGNKKFEILKLGITDISIQQADKAQVISTFGDNFLVQSFGRMPSSIAITGFVISYGNLYNAWALQEDWKNFLSFSAFYEGILESRKYKNKGHISLALLHYNSILYQCLFNIFSRTKTAQASALEYVRLAGIVLSSSPLPEVNLEEA